MSDKPVPILHIPHRDHGGNITEHQRVAPRGSYNWENPPPPNSWKADRTIPIIWIAVIFAMTIGSSAFAWAWQQNATSAAREQRLNDIQQQLQQINQHLDQIQQWQLNHPNP